MKPKQRRFGDRVQLVVDEMLHMLGDSSRSRADTARVRSLHLTKLEERVLMSASPMAIVAKIATVIPESSSGASIVDSDGTAGLIGSTDQSSIDPLLDVTLRNNGGFVTTHRLLTGSAAIDAGTTSAAPTDDARGTSRNGPVDIGAFEVTPVLTSTTEQQVNQTAGQTQTTSAQTRGSTQAVSMMPNGNYAVVWSSSQTTGSDANGYGVLMRIYRPGGTALTGELQVNQTFTNNQQWATVSTDNLGNGVVVWTSTGQDHGSTTGVYARRFNAAGAFVGNEFRVNTTTAGAQENAVVDMTGSGSFVVTWSGNGMGD